MTATQARRHWRSLGVDTRGGVLGGFSTDPGSHLGHTAQVRGRAHGLRCGGDVPTRGAAAAVQRVRRPDRVPDPPPRTQRNGVNHYHIDRQHKLIRRWQVIDTALRDSHVFEDRWILTTPVPPLGPMLRTAPRAGMPTHCTCFPPSTLSLPRTTEVWLRIGPCGVPCCRACESCLRSARHL
jgi:hypothetical protein